MRILYVTAELYPFVKTGGLGDVSAALPPALAEAGIDVRLLMPGYPGLLAGIGETSPVASLGPAFGLGQVGLRRGSVPGSGIPVYVIDAPELYDRPGNLYLGPDGLDWPDNHRRFALLGWAAAEIAHGAVEDWAPELVHGHDWHAGLAPSYIAALWPRPVATVMTIHNLAFQGLFPAEIFDDLGLPPGFFAVDGVEFYGQVSFMKAGLFHADRITTVSPTYAREIRTPDEGCGLEGLLAARADRLTGILNGVDRRVWDPAHDPLLAARFDAGDLAGKAHCKAALQAACGLEQRPDTPLFGVVTRLTRQKGMDLLAAAVPDLVAAGAQLVLLGSGDADLERMLAAAAMADPRAVHVRIGYDEALAHAIYAGSDVVMVPSRFEPCGLTQMYAMRYGALPLVRRVGGLADTVTDAAGPDGTGFLFGPATVAALSSAVRSAIAAYRGPRWPALVRNAMQRDFGWDQSARQYSDLYRQAIDEFR